MRLLSSRKGVSPILATLLLIIIVVAVGLTLYAWVTGYTGTQTARASEELVIEAASVAKNETGGGVNATLWVRNTGLVNVTVGSMYVSNGTYTESVSITPVPVNPGSTAMIKGVTSTIKYTSGGSYTIRIVTSTGKIFETIVRAP